MNTSKPKNPLYQELYLNLRKMIENGTYAVGTRLPSEKELADEYGVSRITSKHALDRLAAEGCISRFPGKGSYVQGLPVKSGDDLLSGCEEKSQLIGVVMEGIQADFGVGLLTGIEKQCSESGYSAVLKFTNGNGERECACIDELLDVGVEGILLMCVHGEVYNSTIMKMALAGFPIVFMDRSLFGLPIPYVGTNHYDAAFCVTGELVKRGHRQLGLAMTEDSHTATSAESRVQGYVQSCIENELLCANRRLLLAREDPLTEGAVLEDNIERIKNFMELYPETSAIVALSTSVAVNVISAQKKLGLDFAIASFDGPRSVFEPACDFMYVQQDQLQMGMTACARLIDKINGIDVPMSTTIPYEIIRIK